MSGSASILASAAGRVRPLLYLAAIAGAALWAFAPLGELNIEAPSLVMSAPVEVEELGRIDLAAFDAPLWLAPPPPPPPERPPPPSPPPPPLKHQLLAIVREEGTLKAILYDPDADRLVVVAEGEPLGNRTIERIGEMAVDIRDTSGIRTLTLADAGTPRGGSR